MNSVLEQKIKQLPALPETATRLEAIYHNPDSSFDDMVKVLELDPLLTADILKAANSPLYGFTREINSITQAVGLFGMGTIRGFALAMITKKCFKLDLSPYNISEQQFSDLSKMQNALAVTWYLRQKPKILNLLSPASFLTEIGKVLISQCLLENGTDTLFKEKISNTKSIKSVEEEMCKTFTAKVSADVFDHWNFDKELINLIRFSGEPEKFDKEFQEASKALHVIRTAVNLDGTFTQETLSQAKELVEKYELDSKSFETAIEKMSS